ncbi:hypothetical protein [Methylomonas rapida]|uniref:Uncharacterized protein n=1 Tax=Methylomonas rapida TaxID=2963939 RepID=A0ABY7GME0_9GAMM|nr:hypothetical protein [Methylomonas rapida]WAR45651.1 hypothetical protein NM686_003810 [Methylomonas rapida]
MHSTEANLATQQDITQLHAATCLLMTRFINGHHCPKLAHVIVHQLQRLLTHPALEHVPASQEMYRQLLEHWQSVAMALLEHKKNQSTPSVYH